MDIFYGVEIILFLGLCIWFSRKVKKQAQERLIFYFLLFFAGIFISYVLSVHLKSTILSGIIWNMSWSYVIEDPFAVSRIGAALIRWMIDIFWILILDGMMKQQSV